LNNYYLLRGEQKERCYLDGINCFHWLYAGGSGAI
jgi:hypothetical protein